MYKNDTFLLSKNTTLITSGKNVPIIGNWFFELILSAKNIFLRAYFWSP